MKIIISLFLPVYFIAIGCIAQNARINDLYGDYTSKYAPERIHVHFDRTVYSPGETIWFKAYLLAADSAGKLSKTIYVDVFDGKGNLLKHIADPVYLASAKGQFEIPGDYSGRDIHIKAYTSWMLNFDSAFIYTKDISIILPKPGKQDTVSGDVSLHFYPEGGDIIRGLNSTVAFSATDPITGMPVDIKGALRNEKGEISDSFFTEHNGMGSLNLQADALCYSVSFQDLKGKTRTALLPDIKEKGIALNCKSSEGNLFLTVSRNEATVDPSFQQLNIVGVINEQLVFNVPVSLSTKLTGHLRIPVEKLPAGILQVTVLNAQLLPLAERIIFINNEPPVFHIQYQQVGAQIGKRTPVSFELSLEDSAAANLSVAVTDATVPAGKENIFTRMLFTGELKGTIIDPAYYFSGQSPVIQHNLDLVMLTHGWRRILWEEILAQQYHNIIYPHDTDYIQLDGTVTDWDKIRKLDDKRKLIALIYLKDASRQTYILDLDDKGRFKKNGLLIFDTASVYCKITGDKRFRNDLEISNGLINNVPFRGKLQFNHAYNAQNVLMDHSFEQISRKMLSHDSAALGTTLKEVVVHGYSKSPVELMDERYTSGRFMGGDAALQADLTNDPNAGSATDIFNYLQGKVAGLQMTQSGGLWDIQWRNAKTELFVDEFKAEPEVVLALPVSDIAFIKVFRPPFFGAMGGGAGGAIAIYTRRGSDITSGNRKYLTEKIMNGYTSYKEFYSPDYSKAGNFNKDSRVTLYWEPYVVLNHQKIKQILHFYNNDFSEKLRVTIEGINAEGKFIHMEQLIENKP